MKEIESTDRERTTLARFALLNDLNSDDLAELASQCQWREYASGEQMLIHGDKGTDVYFLVFGTAHVLNFAESGRAVDYATLSDGDVFGELAAIDGLPRSASVAATSNCTVAVIPGVRFLNLVIDHRQISLALLIKLAGIIRMGDERIVDLSLLGAEPRVCQELLRAAAPDPADQDNMMIYPIPTQVNIANKIGVTRETVSRIFGRLSSSNIIERKNKTLYIREIAELERLALS